MSADSRTLAGIYSRNRDVFLSRWSIAVEHRPALNALHVDAGLRLAARDFHAHDRVLLLGGPGTHSLAAALASASPRTRVTLLCDESEASAARKLLAAGVEVVRVVREDEWLGDRAGHYSHVLAAPGRRWLGLSEVLRDTQPQAALVDVTRLEAAARTEHVGRLMSSLGIAR